MPLHLLLSAMKAQAEASIRQIAKRSATERYERSVARKE
jgi:hypothetical protein